MPAEACMDYMEGAGTFMQNGLLQNMKWLIEFYNTANFFHIFS